MTTIQDNQKHTWKDLSSQEKDTEGLNKFHPVVVTLFNAPLVDEIE